MGYAQGLKIGSEQQTGLYILGSRSPRRLADSYGWLRRENSNMEYETNPQRSG